MLGNKPIRATVSDVFSAIDEVRGGGDALRVAELLVDLRGSGVMLESIIQAAKALQAEVDMIDEMMEDFATDRGCARGW